MSNSPLVNYTKISQHKTPNRNHKIDTITIHCYVGQASVESMGSWFSNPGANCSCNYGIGEDGRIALIVDEKDRSWCSSSSSNDNRAITIECASEKTAPFEINDKVYASLIKLCADICKRNGIKELKWRGDKTLIGQVDKQNMTVHRWFKNKDCPGEYIYNRLGRIAREVNEQLGVDAPQENSTTKTPFKVKVDILDLNIRTGPGTNYTKTGEKTGIGIFTITEVQPGKGADKGWGKLASGAGWISLDFTKFVDSAFKVKVDIIDLNIRKGPGKNYEKTGNKTGIGVFTIVETRHGLGSTYGWGRLKSGEGWISLDYVKRI